MRGVGIDLTLDFCPDPSVVLLALSFCSVGPDLFLPFFSFIIIPPTPLRESLEVRRW